MSASRILSIGSGAPAPIVEANATTAAATTACLRMRAILPVFALWRFGRQGIFV
jgi:hypothetical protein